MGTLAVILKIRYACGSVIKRDYSRAKGHWMSCTNQCVSGRKMNEVRYRKIGKAISVGMVAVVVLTCGVICVALVMAFS